MESPNTAIQTEKRKFQLYEHPWLSLLAVIVTTVFSIGLTGTVIFGLLGLPGTSPTVQFAQAMSYHILIIFIFAPFALRLPKGLRYISLLGVERVSLVFYYFRYLSKNPITNFKFSAVSN